MAKSFSKKLILLIFAVIIICICMTGRAHGLTTNVRVGFCSYMSPYQYVDSDGKPMGFHIDLMEEVAGDTDLFLEYIAFDTTSTAMEALEKGEVDMVLGVSNDQFKSNSAIYSSPISTANLCMVAKEKTAEKYRLDKKAVGKTVVEFGLLEYTYMANISRGNVILTGNQEISIETLVNGKADLMVGVKESIFWYLEEKDMAEDYVIINNYLSSADFTIAVGQGDRYLRNSINESLSALRTSSTYDDLYDQWFSFTTVNYRNLFRIAILTIAGVLVAVAVYMLISYRRRTDHAEAESRLRYSIIEASPAGMALIDQDYIIEYMNRKAKMLAGISSYNAGTSLMNMRIFGDIIEKTGGNMFSEDWESKAGTLEYTRRKGKAVKEKYRYNIQKVTPYGGSPGALLTVENITTEEREREAAFEKEKNETLNNLIAGIAHEIKNPLTAINASAIMMEKKGHSEKFRKAFTDYIPQEIDRITRLIDSLLDYARPSISKIEEVNIAEIIQAVYELSKVTAKRTEITMKLRDKEKLYVNGDKDKIKQSLLNLLINSIEATRLQGSKDNLQHHISIEGFAENDNVVIKITDDGIGMTPRELEKCTTPFYTTKTAGTGIGLALTRQYVEEAEGRIIIDSVKNQFTCVEIQLPALINEEGN